MNLWYRIGGIGTLVVLATITGCRDAKRSSASAADPSMADSMGVAPTHVAAIPLRTTRDVRENSALALSATQPGVLFMITDSGNDPILFALDTTGADRGAWRVQPSTNVDWEAAAVGPCGAASTASCVYVGDVGDNEAKYPTRTLYRVHEPESKDSSLTGSAAAEHVGFTYSDKQHDVEAMYVAPNGDAYLITKRPLRGATAQLRPALVFRLPASAWSSDKTATAELIDSISIVPGSAPLRTITDASLSRDALHLAVRTYAQLFVYVTDPSTGAINHATPPAICNLTSLGEEQGEGVTWLSDGGRFAFSSEGKTAPLHIADCPIAPTVH